MKDPFLKKFLGSSSLYLTAPGQERESERAGSDMKQRAPYEDPNLGQLHRGAVHGVSAQLATGHLKDTFSETCKPIIIFVIFVSQ